MFVAWDSEEIKNELVVKPVNAVAVWDTNDGYVHIAQRDMNFERDDIVSIPKELVNNLIIKLQMLVDD